MPCGQRPSVVGYGESPDGFSPLHDVADATRVGLGFARLHGRGRCRGRGCGAGGIGVQIPLPCLATEQVEVDGTPRVDHAGAGVLAHGLAVRADHPRVGLIAGRAHVRVLGDPQAVPVADVLRDGAGHRAGVQQWAHTAAQSFALRHESAYPIPIAPCGIVVHLPIQRHDAVTPIVRRVAIEELGFRLRVASHRVVIQTEFLAGCLCLGDHAVGVRVDAGHQAVVVDLPGAPCGADHDEIGLHVVHVRAALPVAHVHALHVRVRGRRKQHHADGGGQCRDLGEQALMPWLRLALVIDHMSPFSGWIVVCGPRSWAGIVTAHSGPSMEKPHTEWCGAKISRSCTGGE